MRNADYVCLFVWRALRLDMLCCAAELWYGMELCCCCCATGHAALCYAMLCSCYVMRCDAMLCHAMLCSEISDTASNEDSRLYEYEYESAMGT